MLTAWYVLMMARILNASELVRQVRRHAVGGRITRDGRRFGV